MWFDPVCDMDTRAYSLPQANLVVLCPALIIEVRSELQTVKDMDHSNTGDYVPLATMKSISSIMLHELLHITFDNSSECASWPN